MHRPSQTPFSNSPSFMPLSGTSSDPAAGEAKPKRLPGFLIIASTALALGAIAILVWSGHTARVGEMGLFGHLLFGLSMAILGVTILGFSVFSLVSDVRAAKAGPHITRPKQLAGLLVVAGMLVLGFVFLALGLGSLGDFIADKIAGPQTGSFTFVSESYKTSHGRSAWMDSPHYEVKFQNPETSGYLVFNLTEDEWNSYGRALRSGSGLPLTYYGHSQVLVAIGDQMV